MPTATTKLLQGYNDKQLSRITLGSDFALWVSKPLFCLVHFGAASRSKYDVLKEVFTRTKSSGTLLTAVVPSSSRSSSAA